MGRRGREQDADHERLEALAARQDEVVARLDAIAGRQEEIVARLDAIAPRQHDVIARLDAIAPRQHDVIARLDAIAPRQEEVIARLEDIGRELVAQRESALRLKDTQGLVARVYEQAQGWPALLAEARARPDYERPYRPDPLVSITIPTYHRPELLCERALASVRRQTYDCWEVIVVGDHCTDDTEERVRALGDERIRFENLPFRGPYPPERRDAVRVYGGPASNRAIELARGDWIAALDDDDEWDDDHLEVLLAEARRTRAEVVYGRWRLRDAVDGRQIAHRFGEWPLRIEQFAFQAAIYHQALAALPHDVNCRFAGEPGDWNRARRLWEAGARFAFLDREVSTVWFTPRTDEAVAALEWLTSTAGYQGS